MSNFLVPVLDNFQWQKSVISIRNTPGTASKGYRYLIGTSPTGDWSTKANNITYYSGTAWVFISPVNGMKVWIEELNQYYIYYSSTWTQYLDNDSALTGNSTTRAPSQQAVKTYVDALGVSGNTIRDLTLNIMLNAFRIAQQGALTLLQMVDGFIDEYEDESGVDTANSTNESYNSTDDYYSPSSESIDSYTKLLLHLDNNVTDSATGKTVTNNGVTFSSETKKFGSHSGLFNASSGYLSLADSADWTFGTGDFTIDVWVYMTGTYNYILYGGADFGHEYIYFYTGNGTIEFAWMTGSTESGLRWTFAKNLNQWYHVSLVRHNINDWHLFIDGVEATLSATWGSPYSASLPDLTTGLNIGYSYGIYGGFTGYMDEFRISKGIARWPTDSYTKLLLNGNGLNESLNIVDSESTAKTPTLYGDVQLSTEQKKYGGSSLFFGQQDSYTKLLLHLNNNVTDAATGKTVTNNSVTFSTTKKFGTHSGYFSGSNAYLALADNDDWDFPGDFTIDFWINMSSLAATQTFAGNVDGDASLNGWRLNINSSGNIGFTAMWTGSTYAVNASWASGMSTGTWYHIAIVRNGTTITCYKDGTSLGDYTNNPATSIYSSYEFRIGTDSSGGFDLNGYIDDFRISKGIARWTSNFTAPTFPHGALSYLTVPDSDDFNFGTGAFTIDMWVRFTIIDSNNQWFFGPYVDNSNHSRFGYVPALGLYFNAYLSASTVINFTCPWTPVINTWYHIAVVRISATDATTHRLYIDGVAQTLTLQAGAWTGTMPDFGGSIYIGRFGSNSEYINGYIDNLRVSKGIARWTENFTPPTISSLDFTPPTAQYGSVLNMTLLSNAQIAAIVPVAGRIILFEEDVDSITLNTDIKAYVSRDNGTTYTQVTLEDCGNYVAGAQILQGEVSISAQPSGSNMKYKVETLNNKNLKLHGTAVSWK